MLRRQRGIYLGTDGNWFLPARYRLTDQELHDSHILYVANSGYGKSRGITAIELQLHGRAGTAMIDPHGDTVKLILKTLVAKGFYRKYGEEAFRRVIYLPFGHPGGWVPLNPLRGDPYQASLNLLDAVHRVFPSDAFTPMLDTTLLTTSYVLAANGLSIAQAQPLLQNRTLRQRLLANIANPDPVIMSAFADYDRLAARDQLEQAGALIRRVLLLLFSPGIKGSLISQDCLPFAELMSARPPVCLLYDLSAIPQAESKNLIAALLLIGHEQATMERATTNHRPPFYIFCEELASYSQASAQAIETFLSQSRKFGVFVVGAVPGWSKAEHVRRAWGHARIRIVGHLSADDAALEAAELGTYSGDVVKVEPVREGMYPLFEPLVNQKQAVINEIMELTPGWALVKSWLRPTFKVKLVNVPDPQPDPVELQEVYDTYARIYLKQPSESEPNTTPTKSDYSHEIWQEGGEAL